MEVRMRCGASFPCRNDSLTKIPPDDLILVTHITCASCVVRLTAIRPLIYCAVKVSLVACVFLTVITCIWTLGSDILCFSDIRSAVLHLTISHPRSKLGV